MPLLSDYSTDREQCQIHHADDANSSSGHYDILYKIEDVAEMMASDQINPHIAFLPSLSGYNPFSAAPMYQSDMLAWADIPGLSLATTSPPTTNGFPSPIHPHGDMRDDGMVSPTVPSPVGPQTYPNLGPPMRPPLLDRRESSFRPSKYEIEVAPAPSRPFQTSAFEQ